MDRISQLPDELLLKILSLLPTTDVVATMVLSKRWKPLWMLVPNLEYYDTNLNTEYSRFSRFVQYSLFLNEAPVLENLFFRLGPRCGALDLKIWVKFAVTRSLRKLDIVFSCNQRLIKPPESLYTCKTLGNLNLCGAVLVDAPVQACLPSLTYLYLVGVTYSGDESVLRLLSGCPVLECLGVQRTRGDNVKIFKVKVPSLLALKIGRESEEFQYINHGTVIDAPSLLLLTIMEHNGGFCLLENSPKVGRAKVDVANCNCQKLMGSLTYVKHLQLCLLVPTPAYPKGTIFHRLRNLELCTCINGWLNLLMSLLQDSPKLRVLKLKVNHLPQTTRPAWIQPSSVPECVSSELRSLEWSGYKGTQEESELVKFILRNGNGLKTVVISPKSTNLKQKFRMIKELTLSSRGSPTCELVFN